MESGKPERNPRGLGEGGASEGARERGKEGGGGGGAVGARAGGWWGGGSGEVAAGGCEALTGE